MTRIHVKEFTASDLDYFVNMSREEYGATNVSDPQWVRWKHLGSPYGSSLYIRLVESAAIVGRVMVQPRLLYTQTKAFNAGATVDLLIERTHRKSPVGFTSLSKACGELPGLDLLFHTSNSRTQSLYTSLLRYPSPFKLRGYGFPLRLSGLLSILLRCRVDAIDLFMKPIHWFIVILAMLLERFANVKVSAGNVSDCELTMLREKCLQQGAPHLGRNGAYLKWRFGEPPSQAAEVFRFEQQGKLVGYIAACDLAYGRLRHFVLLDYLLDSEKSLIVRLAFRLWVLRSGIAVAADSVFTMANANSVVAAAYVGFPLIKIPDCMLPHSTPIFVRASQDEAKSIEVSSKLHLTLADLDYF